MGDTAIDPRDLWIELILKVKLERTRRRELRLELAARGKAVSATVATRLKAISPGSRGAADLIGQVQRGKQAMDLALQDPALAADDTPKAEFDAAAARARLALESLSGLFGEAASLATAQAMDAETAQRNVLRRQQAHAGYATLLADIGARQAQVLQHLSPGALDTELRDMQNAAQAALAAMDRAPPADDVAFTAAWQEAGRQVALLERKADIALDARVELANAVGLARQALTEAEQAAARAAATAGIFAPELEASTRTLAAQRNALAPADGLAAVQRIAGIAATEAGRAGLIAAAGVVATKLGEAVESAAAAAENAVGAALRQAWAKAVAAARQALGAGTPAVAGLEAIESQIDAATSLTELMQRLRPAAAALETRRTTLPDILSKEEAVVAEQVKALAARIATEVPGPGTLEGDLAKATLALDNVEAAAVAFALRQKQVADKAKGVESLAGWRTAPAAIFAQKAKATGDVRRRDAKGAESQLAAIESFITELAALVVDLQGWVSAYAGMARRNSNYDPSSAVALAGNAVKDFDAAKLANPRLQVTEKYGALQAFAVLDAVLGPHEAALELLARGNVATELRGPVTQALKSAREAAARADAAGAINAIRPFIDGLATLQSTEPALKAAAALCKDAAPPLAKAVQAAQAKLGEALKTAPFANVAAAVQTLEELLAAAPAWRKAQAELARMLAKSAPAEGETALLAAHAAAVEARDAALDASAASLGAATTLMRTRARALLAAGGSRALAALAPEQEAGRFASLFADAEASQATLALADALGMAELATLVASLAASDAAVDGPAAARAVKALRTAPGPAKLQEMAAALGPKALGGLCTPAGDTGLVVALEAEFAADLAPLGSLVKDGFRGKAEELRIVVGADATGAERAKALSDRFTDRAELSDMLGSFNSATAARDALAKIAATNFADDWEKLKDPFYDNLKGRPDHERLIARAKNFEGEAVGAPVGPADLKGFASVAMAHTVERHRPESFDFAKPGNIKPSNTQFGPGTSTATIADIIGKALGLLRGHLTGPASAKVAHLKTKGTFIKYSVTVDDPGVVMQIGFNTVTQAVEQAFPLYTTSGATISLDDFDAGDMNAMKRALGR